MSDRLDNVARAMADPKTVGRRGWLRKMGAVLGVGAAAAVVQADPAAAGKTKDKGLGSDHCPIGFVNCGDVCRDLANANTDCGACGNVCGPDEICRNGTCVRIPCTCGDDPGCPSGTTDCGAGCVDLQSDASHCGACGTVCGPGQSCVGGACVAGTCDDGIVNGNETDVDCGGPDCPPCADGSTCIENRDCASGLCDAGICAAVGCSPGTDECNGVCVDTSADPNHCGACGVACGPHAACVGGACICDAGFIDCNGDGTGCQPESTSGPTCPECSTDEECSGTSRCFRDSTGFSWCLAECGDGGVCPPGHTCTSVPDSPEPFCVPDDRVF